MRTFTSDGFALFHPANDRQSKFVRPCSLVQSFSLSRLCKCIVHRHSNGPYSNTAASMWAYVQQCSVSDGGLGPWTAIIVSFVRLLRVHHLAHVLAHSCSRGLWTVLRVGVERWHGACGFYGGAGCTPHCTPGLQPGVQRSQHSGAGLGASQTVCLRSKTWDSAVAVRAGVWPASEWSFSSAWGDGRCYGP